MSISDLFGLNISTILIIYSLNNPNPMNSNLFFCEIQFYFRHAFNQLLRTFFVLTDSGAPNPGTVGFVQRVVKY